MKSVLISIQPKWCELIASGKKTVEVRKTKPKLETPFKVYIYCTKGRGDCLWRWNGIWYDTQDPNHRPNRLDGKVIGEFVCDKIYNLSVAIDPYDCSTYFPDGFDHTEGTCLTQEELSVYLCGGSWNGKGYGWHITDLVVYDEPRELRKFRLPCDHKNDCCTCERAIYTMDKAGVCSFHRCSLEEGLTRPPQSWCYVERSENGKS